MHAWQATVQDESGNIIPLPVVTVYLNDGVTLANIYSEQGNPLPNPLTGTMGGFVQFWVESGKYKILGAKGGDQTEVWSVTIDPPAISLTPEEFGAIGDGVTNDLTAIQLAVNTSAAQSRELVLTKTYFINGDITVPSGARIRATGGSLEGCTIKINGTYGSGTSLTSDIQAGVSVIPVASTSAFAAGDYIRIVSCINSQGPSAGDYILGDRRDASPPSWLSENAKILRVDATNIYIEGRTIFPYSITPDADSGGRTTSSVYKLNLADNIKLTDITVRRTSATISQSPLYAEYMGPGVVIKGCTFDCSTATYVYARPVYLGMCYGSRFEGCSIHGIKVEPLSGSQGNFEIRSCQDVWINDCDVNGGNQGIDVTTGAYETVGGPSIGIRIENSRFSGTYTDAVTTHWACYGTIIRGNLIRSRSGNGIRIRSKYDLVENNVIQGPPGGIGSGVFISNIPMRGMTVRGNTISGFRDSILITVLFESRYTRDEWPNGQLGVSIYNNTLTSVTGGRDCIRVETTGQPSSKPINVSIFGNTMKMAGTPVSISGVHLMAYANGCYVSNNEMTGFAYGVYIMRNCAGGIIEGNRMIDCTVSSIRGQSASGKQIEDTATFGTLPNAGFAIQRNYYIRSPSHLSIPAELTGLTPESITS